MTSVRFLLVLVLCGAFRAQTIVTENEGDVILNPEKSAEDDVRVLLQQLTARVEQLEKQREDRGQCSGLRSNYKTTITELCWKCYRNVQTCCRWREGQLKHMLLVLVRHFFIVLRNKQRSKNWIGSVHPDEDPARSSSGAHRPCRVPSLCFN